MVWLKPTFWSGHTYVKTVNQEVRLSVYGSCAYPHVLKILGQGLLISQWYYQSDKSMVKENLNHITVFQHQGKKLLLVVYKFFFHSPIPEYDPKAIPSYVNNLKMQCNHSNVREDLNW